MARGGRRPGAGRPRKTEAAPTPPRRRGRPSAYDPAFCEEIVDFCAQGFSITGFAGQIGVSRSTLSDWQLEFPEFGEAVRRAKAAFTLALEKDAKRIREHGGGPGTATVTIFGLKNMAPDDYSDKQTVEHSGPNGGPVQQNVTHTADDAFASLVSALELAGRAKAGGAGEPGEMAQSGPAGATPAAE